MQGYKTEPRETKQDNRLKLQGQWKVNSNALYLYPERTEFESESNHRLPSDSLYFCLNPSNKIPEW